MRRISDGGMSRLVARGYPGMTMESVTFRLVRLKAAEPHDATQRRPGTESVSQQTLFLQALTSNTIDGPGHGLQAFRLDRLLTVDTNTVGFVFDALERFVDHLQSRTIA